MSEEIEGMVNEHFGDGLQDGSMFKLYIKCGGCGVESRHSNLSLHPHRCPNTSCDRVIYYEKREL